MPAIMVTRCRYYRIGSLFVADTQILSIDQAGAKHFARPPRELVGMHMSDLQSQAWREAGHRRYLDRKLGKPLSKDYVVMVQRPDGEEIPQRREFGGFMMGKEKGEDVYLTYLEHVMHCDAPPTLQALSPAEQRLARAYNGDCTVAELRRRLATKNLPLALLESFQHIIRECEELSSGYFAGKYTTPLDLALSDDVAVCWDGKQGPKIRPRFPCDRCGWVWYGRAKQRAECTACGQWYRDYRKK